MSLPLVATTVAGGTLLLIGVYSRLFLPKLSPDLGFVPFGVAVFLAMRSWQYFLALGAHFYVTDQRVVIVGSGRPVRELGFDNIEHVSRHRGFKFGSRHIDFIAADGSDIDGGIDGKIMYWPMGFSYLLQRESRRVEQLVRERTVPVKEPRVYRCIDCGSQTGSQEELLEHIGIAHGGSTT